MQFIDGIGVLVSACTVGLTCLEMSKTGIVVTMGMHQFLRVIGRP